MSPRLAGARPPAEIRSWTAFALVILVARELGSRAYGHPYLRPAPTQIACELARHWD